MIDASVELGESIVKLALTGLGQHEVQSHGKGGIVGVAGEQEHANALLTTAFANPIRAAIGGGDSWISSFTKKGGPGTLIDIRTTRTRFTCARITTACRSCCRTRQCRTKSR